MNEDIVDRLRIRAKIRRQAATRKSVQEGKPDRLSDLLEESAIQLELRDKIILELQETISDLQKRL